MLWVPQSEFHWLPLYQDGHRNSKRWYYTHKKTQKYMHGCMPLKESEISFITRVSLPFQNKTTTGLVNDRSQSGTDGHCGYGREIIAHTSYGRAYLNCPLSLGLGSIGGSQCQPLHNSLRSKSASASQNSWWQMVHVNNLWETWGGWVSRAVGCLTTDMLSVCVYIWSSGNHQMCCACCPSKPKSSNCFVVRLKTEIDQSLSSSLTVCKWIQYTG